MTVRTPKIPSTIDAAGIVLGARVPIILTSRDMVRARMASCAGAVLLVEWRRQAGAIPAA